MLIGKRKLNCGAGPLSAAVAPSLFSVNQRISDSTLRELFFAISSYHLDEYISYRSLILLVIDNSSLNHRFHIQSTYFLSSPLQFFFKFFALFFSLKWKNESESFDLSKMQHYQRRVEIMSEKREEKEQEIEKERGGWRRGAKREGEREENGEREGERERESTMSAAVGASSFFWYFFAISSRIFLLFS